VEAYLEGEEEASWEDWEAQPRLKPPIRIHSEHQPAPAQTRSLEVPDLRQAASLVELAALRSVVSLLNLPSHSQAQEQAVAAASPRGVMWLPLASESSKTRHQNHLLSEEHQASEVNLSAPRQPLGAV